MGRQIGMVQIISWVQKPWQNRRWADGIRVEFFPAFNTLQLSEEVKRLLLRLDETPENFTGIIIFMSMFNDISCGSKDNEQECMANAKLVSLHAKRFGKGQWSFISPGCEKKWYCMTVKTIHKEYGTSMAERMLIGIRRKRMSNFPRYKPIVQRSTQKKRTWKNCRYTMQPIWNRLRLFFA